MAEETQENMSMDDILSSIKNILSENDETATQFAQEPEPVVEEDSSANPDNINFVADALAPQELEIPTEQNANFSSLDSLEQSFDSSDEKENDTLDIPDEDGIFDLTSEMQVKADENDSLSGEDINIADELQNISSDESDPLDLPKVEDSLENTDSLVADGVGEVPASPLNLEEADPVFMPDEENDGTPSIEEVSAFEEALSGQNDTSAEIDMAEFDAEKLPDPTRVEDDIDYTQEIELAQAEMEKEGPQKADEDIPTPESLIEDFATSREQPVQNASENAVDASANIINNFAKIFAGQEKQKQSVEAQNYVPVTCKLGADATLSDMVKATIRDMIAEPTVDAIIQDADINHLIKDEVSIQVKAWLNQNLPTMVEKIVKQEIERVMVKAGKN